MPSDFETTIWWQIYPLGATGAPIRDRKPGDDNHRLTKLIAWMDYAVELGCNGLLLGPIFESSAHGYDTTDYFKIDSRLGDENDWQRFVAEAHSRGLRIMLDGVFNHVGVNHPWVKESLANGGGLVKVNGQYPQHWEGNLDLATLNHANPKVQEIITDVMTYWCQRGADAWRLDAAYSMPPTFWATVLPKVRAKFPKVYFVGEMIHGDYCQYASQSTINSITQYELWKATWSSLADDNMWELAHALERHEKICQSITPLIFIGNHDVDRIASKVGKQKALLATIMLFTMPGVISIYYGDEQGFTGVKGEDIAADDPIRPPLPDCPDDLFTDKDFYNTYRAMIHLRRSNPWLTKAAIEVVDKQNEWIEYRTKSGENQLDAKIISKPVPKAEIKINGQAVYFYTAD